MTFLTLSNGQCIIYCSHSNHTYPSLIQSTSARVASSYYIIHSHWWDYLTKYLPWGTTPQNTGPKVLVIVATKGCSQSETLLIFSAIATTVKTYNNLVHLYRTSLRIEYSFSTKRIQCRSFKLPAPSSCRLTVTV